LAVAAIFVGGLALVVANTENDTKVIKPDRIKVERVARPTIGFGGDMWSSMGRFWDRSIAQRPHAEILTLPVPEPAPADPYASEDLPDVGRIQIPRIGLDTELHQGVTLTSIDRGPSYWPGSALPGQFGNLVIAGHRVTNSRPFRDIDQLQPGDRITVVDNAGIPHVYEVTSSEIVTPDKLDIVSQPVGYEATLFACHPPGSAEFRFVVHLRLLDWEGKPKTMPPYEIVHT
jgi:LPXTG-site transpeptidase (sortase) family protein